MNVEDLLRDKNIYARPKGNDYIIRCLNPEHEDKNPSLRVDRVTGVFHCFSCGYKGNLFDFFDLRRDDITERVYFLRRKIQEILIAQKGLDMPEGSVPFTRAFRGISKKTYTEFEAFSNEQEFPSSVVFPLKDISGRVYAFIARHTHSDAKDSKYMVYPPKAKLELFPSKVSPIHNSIILVEGIFDMLNLWDKGLTNAVCLFGVSTLTDKNLTQKLRNYKIQGVQILYLMLDGDNAGRGNAKRLKKLLTQRTDFVVEVLDFLEDGSDPGALTKEEVKDIHKYLYKE